MRQSSKTNVLDYSFDSHSEIPRILSDFAGQCVAAAQNDTKYCPFATASLNASDPTAALYGRINSILEVLGNQTYTTKTGETASLMFLGSAIRGGLMKTGSFPSLANTFLQMEQIIANVSGTTEASGVSGGNQELPSVVDGTIRENVNTTAANSSQISVVGWDPNDPFAGVFNIFTFPAVTCLDVSYANIDTAQTFTNYLYNQIQQNPLVGELGGSFASCLGWPNLTAYNPETIYADNYPSKLANQMLVIGVTDDPVCPYPGALETYELIGDENAVFLVHAGMGHCSVADPNNCTYDVLTSYFVNGTPCRGVKTNVRNGTDQRNDLRDG